MHAMPAPAGGVPSACRRNRARIPWEGRLPGVRTMHGKPSPHAHPVPEASTDRLKFFFQQAPGMIAILGGPGHVFEFANAAYLDLVGGRDVIGRRVARNLPQLEKHGNPALLQTVSATGPPLTGPPVAHGFQRPG